jgi:hypothetical protein
MVWIASPEQLRYLAAVLFCSVSSGTVGFARLSPELARLATRCMQRPGMTTDGQSSPTSGSRPIGRKLPADSVGCLGAPFVGSPHR